MCDICGTEPHEYVPGKPCTELWLRGKQWCRVCGRGEGSHVHIAADPLLLGGTGQ